MVAASPYLDAENNLSHVSINDNAKSIFVCAKIIVHMVQRFYILIQFGHNKK